MKITILDTIPGEEDEIIIKCQNLSEDIQNLLQKLKQGNTKIAGHNENGIHLLEPDEVYYFETVDNKVFACCKKEVYEVREKLYTLEGHASGRIVYAGVKVCDFKSQQSKKFITSLWRTF